MRADVRISVDGSRPLAETSDRFVAFTMDWHRCELEQPGVPLHDCSWHNASVLSANLTRLLPFAKGLSPYGKTLLRIGGVDVIVVSERSQTFDEGIFRLHGLDVRDYQVVGVKSSTHFRAGFAPIVEECGGVILTADEPGLSTNRLEVFEAQRTVASGLGPMWPVDGAAVYEKALAEARL